MLIVTYKSYDGNWQEIDFSNTMPNRKKLVNDKDFRDVYDEDSKVWLKKDFVAIDNPYGEGELTMKDYKQEFDDMLQDYSLEDGELLSTARDFISELQKQVAELTEKLALEREARGNV